MTRSKIFSMYRTALSSLKKSIHSIRLFNYFISDIKYQGGSNVVTIDSAFRGFHRINGRNNFIKIGNNVSSKGLRIFINANYAVLTIESDSVFSSTSHSTCPVLFIEDDYSSIKVEISTWLMDSFLFGSNRR